MVGMACTPKQIELSGMRDFYSGYLHDHWPLYIRFDGSRPRRLRTPDPYEQLELVLSPPPPPLVFDDMIRRAISAKAVSLIGTYGYTRSDLDDLKQDLAIHLLKRYTSWNPARGAWSTFLDHVLVNKIRNIIEHRQAARRDWRKCTSIPAMEL